MPEETPLTGKRANSRQARRVAELMLIVSDLKNAIRCFELWRPPSPDESAQALEANLINESLFRNGLVTFMACFDSATPDNLKRDDVYSPDNGGTALFDLLKAWRDTWIAHRFGPSRQAEAIFLIDPKTGDVLQDGYFQAVTRVPEYESREHVIRLVKEALAHAEQSLRIESKALRVEVDSLTPFQRLKMPDAIISMPDGTQQQRMGRQKFRNISHSSTRADKGGD